MTTVSRLDGLTGALAVKAPCRAATTSAITLSGLQTVDGVVLATDDRVLVKNQATASENGIYKANTSDWTRAPDFNGTLDAVGGTFLAITEGATNGSKYYKISGSGSVNIGTDAISFVFTFEDQAPGGSFQPLDSDLTAIAALTTTAFGRALLTLANTAALQSAVGLSAYMPLAGGVFTGDISRQGAGEYLHYANSAFTGARITGIDPVGTADSTSQPGDIQFFY